MTDNGLKAKTKVIPQNLPNGPSKFQIQRENNNSSKLRSKKKQSDKVVRRGMRRKKLETVKLRSTKLPYIPQKVLRVLKILRHEKFLDMVQKYFTPVNVKNVNDSASQRSINKVSFDGKV